MEDSENESLRVICIGYPPLIVQSILKAVLPTLSGGMKLYFEGDCAYLFAMKSTLSLREIVFVYLYQEFFEEELQQRIVSHANALLNFSGETHFANWCQSLSELLVCQNNVFHLDIHELERLMSQASKMSEDKNVSSALKELGYRRPLIAIVEEVLQILKRLEHSDSTQDFRTSLAPINCSTLNYVRNLNSLLKNKYGIELSSFDQF